MDWRWNLSAKLNEARRLAYVPHGHDGALAEQTAERDEFASFFAWNWNDPYRSRFIVDHANCHFVGDDGGDGARIH